jgi:Uma2 family endonuclease
MSVAPFQKSTDRRDASARDPHPKKWTGAEYDRLVEGGFFDHQRVELIEGEVFEMSPMNDPHVKAIVRVQYALLKIFPSNESTVLVQCALRLGDDARPEPDLAVAAGSPLNLQGRPNSALLVVEVSDSTLDFDRREKSGVYAENKLPDYWIVNLIDRCLEVHRNPVEGRYAQVFSLKPGEFVSPVASPDAKVAVADLLP